LLKRSGYWVVTLVCLASLCLTVVWPAPLHLPAQDQEQGLSQSEFAWMIKASALSEDNKLHAYANAVELAPTNMIALYNLGVTQYQLAIRTQNHVTMAAAEHTFTRIVALNPDIVAMYFKLGKLALLQNQVKQAEAWYRQGLEVDPANASLVFNLAEVLEQQNEYTQAKALYLKAITLDPQLVYAYNNLGLLYEKANAAKQAESCYIKALDINPGYAHARLNLGALYDTQGMRDAAQAQFEMVLKTDPKNPWANFYMGGLAYRTGNYTDAVNYFQTATTVRGSINAAYYYLALSLIKLNRLDEAISAGHAYLDQDKEGPYSKEMQALLENHQLRNASK
jgi:tetratricopeptide (TPR) repeat protein